MKKLFRKISLILMIVLATGLFTGCSAGSTVETTLNVNDDLSGSRVMELVIDQSVFNEYFSGTIEDLNAAITEGCPAELTWVYDDSTGVKKYIFTLAFSSPSDYKTKVDSIIGEGSDVTIEMTKAESVWASGVMVNESFSSQDILEWLKTLAVDKGFVSSSNSSKIFNLGGNKLVFAGEEYSSYYSDISVDKIEYLSINRIDLLTDAKVYDCYDKMIVISIPEESMEKKGEEIKAWLEERVPTGATSEWSTEDTDTIFTVTKEDMTGEQLGVFLQEYFDSEACTVVQNDLRENQSPFSFNIELFENIDFSNYIVGDQRYYTDVNYYVKGENGYVGGRYFSDLAYVTEDDYDYVSEYEGYRYGRQDQGENGITVFNAYFQKVYRVDKVNVETSMGLGGGLSRTITFVLDAEPTEEEKACIMEKINALGVAYDLKQAEEAAEDENESDVGADAEEGDDAATEDAGEETGENATPQWNVKVTEKSKDGEYSITIKQSGSREEIQASTEALFGSAGDLYSVKDFAFYKLRYDIAVYDNFTLGDFVDYTTTDVEAKYIFMAPVGSEMEFADSENAKADGREVKIKEGVLYGVNVVAYGSQLNFWAIGFYLLIVVAIAGMVLALLKSGILGGLKKNTTPEPAPAAVQENVQPQIQPQAEVAPQEVVQTEAPKEDIRFCGNCGTKYVAGAAFCPECGNKLEG